MFSRSCNPLSESGKRICSLLDETPALGVYKRWQDLEQFVRAAQSACMWSEAVFNQQKAAIDSGWTFEASWLRVRCNCLWAPAVCYGINAMRYALALSLDENAETIRPQPELIAKIVGLGTYVVQRALVQWIDYSSEYMGFTKEQVEQIWRSVHALYCFYSAEKIRRSIEEKTSVLKMADAYTQMAQWDYNVYHTLRTFVPTTLILTWGSHGAPRLTHACDAGTEYASDLKHDAVQQVIQQNQKNKQQALGFTWSNQAHTRWLQSMAFLSNSTGLTSQAVLLLSTAIRYGAYVPTFEELEQRAARLDPILASTTLEKAFPQVKIATPLPVSLPLNWRKPEQLVCLITRVLPLATYL